ncbi:excinuclease ABC subunit UvrA [Candidatus Woesebacteria bacterium]|nr:excinuclease ABC subunit UvrA [Candidatus Woesebacteria bacterium]MCD8545976.1 excinuclease ABC subunit UvrA [Candidatus Woesebacteria bacterium]
MADQITVTGARQHNLKNITVSLPKDKLVVVTGLSGSGKSSFAFDTLYAEGQRRYVESLSAYARQFLGMMQKPEVEHITGLSPAISIDQKTTSHNPRSTVGTVTEIYDYLRLLFARAGRPHDPNTGEEVMPYSLDQIVEELFGTLEQRLATEGKPVRFYILTPVVKDRKGEFQGLFSNLLKKGYTYLRIDGDMYNLQDDISLFKNNKHTIEAVVDRLVIDSTQLKDEKARRQLRTRLNGDIEEALKLSDGWVTVSFVHDAGLDFPEQPRELEDLPFTEKRIYPSTGEPVPEIEPRMFSFNTPHGACPECNGLGTVMAIEVDQILAPSLTLPEGAVIPFARQLENDTWFSRLIRTILQTHDADWRTPWNELPAKLRDELLYGSDTVYTVYGENRFGNLTQIEESFDGFVTQLEKRYQDSNSDFVRKEIERFMRKRECPVCHGKRLRPQSLSVTVDKLSIADVTEMSIADSHEWMAALLEKNSAHLTDNERTIIEPIANEITSRLRFLVSVGLGYLTLHREANTLAGGEAQRIRLASQIGTGLSGVLYVLDEPTIGLHQSDNDRLIHTLQSLRDLDNTVVVVEHDRDVMLASDEILDFGPGAGINGGEVIAQGTPEELMKDPNSVTGRYLARKKDIWLPLRQRTAEQKKQTLGLRGASTHNLKNIDVEFPLHQLVCITGLSGSGKSTLLYDTLYQNMRKELELTVDQEPGKIDSIYGVEHFKRVVMIDQSPIGRTPRSNPATYTKVFDLIREVFANTSEAKERGYKPGRFSFNVKGGRCEACGGEGQVKIEMQFLPDVYVNCEICNGTRYNRETLEVTYHGKNIAEVLEMDVDESVAFFSHYKKLQEKLLVLQDVGLGYIRLGQPAPTLSGGEAQRVKLAKELTTRTTMHTLYLLDEPTTGLHFEDVKKLLHVLDRLIKQGNSMIMIEHNLDVIKNADWLVDLGPGGGDYGGQVVATGTPLQISQHAESETGKYLVEEMRHRPKSL